MSQDSRIQLQEGIAAARSGDRGAARRLLRNVVEEEPNNEMAWIWLASVVGSVAERRACLQRVLQINPSNETAREALSRLDQPDGTESTRRQPTNRQGGGNILNLLIALLFIIVIIGALLLFSSVGPLGDDNNNQVVVIFTPTPLPATFTPRPPDPTRTPNPFSGTSGAPTLPPTFTPTPTPFPSATPTATATPFPLQEFRAVVSSQELGQSQPDAYFYNGDGSSEQLLGYEMRDIAFSPDGQRIAFIRNVDYSGDIVIPPAASTTEQNPEATEDPAAETSIFPELFIADINDVANAQQITELRTSIVSSPTWSPDGREMIFVNNYDGSEDLWYITPDGGNLRRLTINDNIIDRDPAWRPVLGSREILFASDRDSIGSPTIYRFELTEPGIEMVYERVTFSSRSNYAPAWSSDGNAITFVSDRTGDADIYITDYEGALTNQVTFDDNGAEDRSPSFTPDNRFIAFISNRTDDRFQSYLISLDGTVLIRLTNNERDDIGIIYRPELLLRLLNQENR